MDILLVERDRLVRDTVKVGLQQFPEFTVTCGEGYAGLNKLRQRNFDVVFLGVPSNHQEAKRRIEHMRSIDRSADLVVLATGRMARDMAGEKQRYNIWSFLTTPVQVNEFFRLLARMRERLQEADPARGPAPAPKQTRVRG
jgi:DNA-binding NtrC family response regulator